MNETKGQDDTALLLQFLRGRDVPCPTCRYNLRDLSRPECPECRHELMLAVGVTKPKFLWFLVAVAPCMFSGIAAILLLIPMSLQWYGGGGAPEAGILALDAMGWTSLLCGLVLIHFRFAFLRQKTKRQRVFAVIVWALHVLAFLAFMATMLFISGGP